MRVLLMALLLFLLCPVVADESRSKFRLMGVDDIAEWYDVIITKSILEDTSRMRFLNLLILSRDISCIDVIISTDSRQHWRDYSPPTWGLDAENCVDKRTHQCKED